MGCSATRKNVKQDANRHAKFCYHEWCDLHDIHDQRLDKKKTK
jgi:hypothetical protein